MSARERFKRFKGQLRKGLRGNTGAAPAQSAPSLPNAPLPSTSLASAPPAVSPAVAGGSWTGLAHFQNVLTTGLGVFGPLRLVIDDLARCISVHEDAAAARHDYQVLKAELEALFSTLSIYFDCDMPPTMTASIDNICSAIEKELGRISSWERGATRRHWMAGRDLDQVLASYRRIQGHLDRLRLNADLGAWKILDEQTTESRLKALAPSLSAFYNSAEAALVRRRECTPNTRLQVLSDICSWRHDQKKGNLYWLNGMAGTGKTTIASSLCAMLDKSHELGASFFCTRQLPECRIVKMILPTIAYQLARFSRPFRCALSRALERDPDVHARALPNQLEGMIIGPLCEVAPTLPTDLVVVIDALDECENKSGVGQMLELLVKHAPGLPIKVFVSSRPEPQIRQMISSTKAQLVLHELDDKIVKEDIEIYLRAELAGISVSERQLADLVERAGVLFIYAATVTRYIKAEDFHLGQQKRLNVVLSTSLTTSSNKTKDIDELYSAVLVSAFSNPELEDSDKDCMRLVLHSVICAQKPLTIDALAGLLHLDGGDWVRAALQPLWSVLHVSGANDLVNTLHASFSDFMLSPQRSKEHTCDPQAHHGRLAALCLMRIQKNEPKFNICHLESSYVLDEQVPGLEDRVKRAIPLDLVYACQYWAVHLELGGPSSSCLNLIEKFLSMRLLFWLEVLNLAKQINIGPTLLEKAGKWCRDQEAVSDTKDLVHDAWRFVRTFSASPLSHSTPHIYISMLASWPSSQPISKRYLQRTKHLVKVTGTGIEKRELALLGIIAAGARVTSIGLSPNGMRVVSGCSDNAVRVWDAQSGQMILGPLQGHTKWVSAVSISPDGTRIVTGSGDNTIRVWDAHNGQIAMGPLQGHTRSVSSVVFSPDGKRIASGSEDRTIRMWDGQTGQVVVAPLQGHTNSVFSVTFSPNGLRIASGSEDQTIRVWDAYTGHVVLGPLQGHTGFVYSVAFSSDSMRIVSGSQDKTICVWDARTGQIVMGPLRGHTSLIYSVACSPEGMYFISGSDDKTVRVWDARTGQLRLRQLEGHTNSVRSVAFSSDGMSIVSGSMDKTIRVWDVQTQQIGAQILEGHTDSVYSVAYSFNGTCIVSGSADNSIQVWDAQDGQLVLGPLEGHTDSIFSVSFSPDDMYVVSGSGDNSARVWDVQTGQMTLQLQGHTKAVHSVAFSPNGRSIVSGSYDKTIRVWDSQTGQMMLGPLQGHTDWVLSVLFSPDGKRILSSSEDKTIGVWDAQTGQMVVGPLQGHSSLVHFAAFSPDGLRIASCSEDQTIRVWDSHSGHMVLGPLQGHTGYVYTVAFSPDGMRIVSGSQDKTISVWDALTGQIVLGPLQGHTSLVYSVAFSPDGKRIVSGSQDRAIRIWDAQSGHVALGPAETHPFQVSDDPLQHDGFPIVSSPGDNTIAMRETPHSSTLMSLSIPRVSTPSKTQAQDAEPSPSSLSWQLNPDGWVVDKQSRLLFWVPHDLYDRLIVSPNSIIISTRGSVQLQFDHALIGESWAECYLPDA